MKIGIDARMLDWSGVGRYTRNLIGGLAKIDQENEYILFVPPHCSLISKERWVYRPFLFPPFSIGEQFAFPLILKREKIDLFHSPHFLNPFLGVKKLILTIHDLIPLHFPQYFSPQARFYFRQILKRGIKKAEKIITVSQFSKKDILNSFKVKEEKIEVIPNAVSKIFHPVLNLPLIKKFKKKYAIDQPYILYVGNKKPHKNLERLIKSFKLLKRKDYLLILAGQEFPRNKSLNVAKNTIPQVKFLEFIPDNELPLLYNGAEIFVFPSLYEGFGLPPLEAMACGVPVITSHTSSLPEVVGKAAVMIDSENTEELAEAMEGVLSNKNLRDGLRKKGLAQAKLFSLDKLAQRTLQIYKSCGK